MEDVDTRGVSLQLRRRLRLPISIRDASLLSPLARRMRLRRKQPIGTGQLQRPEKEVRLSLEPRQHKRPEGSLNGPDILPQAGEGGLQLPIHPAQRFGDPTSIGVASEKKILERAVRVHERRLEVVDPRFWGAPVALW